MFHLRNSALVMRIVTIEIGEERARVTDRDHGRRNLMRAFVAGNGRPARLPAKRAWRPSATAGSSTSGTVRFPGGAF